MGRHSAPKPRRTRRAAWALAALGALGLAGGGAYALWSGQVSLSQTVSVGTAHFAAGSPAPDGAALPSPYRLAWRLPPGGLGSASDPLAPGGTFTSVVQLDAHADGNRGIKAQLARVGIADPAGTGYLASHLGLTAFEVPSPGACTPAAVPSGTQWYSGPLKGARTAPRELVPPGPLSQATTYLCLRFTLDPQLATTYANTATVTGLAAGEGGTPGPEVSASSSWHAAIAPPDGAYSPEVTFEFSWHTYRQAAP